MKSTGLFWTLFRKAICELYIYYARVPSSEQNLACQLAVFATLGADDRKIDTDKETDRSFDSYAEPRSHSEHRQCQQVLPKI